jgi:hypothetical protein
MRRWFELGEIGDSNPTYSAKGGDRIFLQLPQKGEFIAWANSMVNKIARVTTGGDPTVCDGGGAPLHLISSPGVTVITQNVELRSLVLLGGDPSSGIPALVRSYFDKPGINDGPNETQTVEKPRGGKAGGGGGTFKISLLSYLLLLLQTWQGVKSGTGGKFIAGTGNVPQRWIEWLTTLINHYGRYTPTQIYGFLARVDFTKATFKV